MTQDKTLSELFADTNANENIEKRPEVLVIKEDLDNE